jgi:hypothetical protein
MRGMDIRRALPADLRKLDRWIDVTWLQRILG